MIHFMTRTLIFIDTETTGTGEADRLCQLAFITKENMDTVEQYNELFNPGKKIPPDASAVTHITNKMVQDKPAFQDSADYARIKTLLESPDSVFIAHNAPFDLGMMRKESIVPSNFICTLRVARYLDQTGKIPKYNLQFLRYFLEIEIDAPAHDALGDVLVLCELFPRLYKSVAKELEVELPEQLVTYDDRVIERMIEISSKPSIMHTFNFGKHVGKKVSEVAKMDRGYLEWMLEQKKNSDTNEEDWVYTLEYFLK